MQYNKRKAGHEFCLARLKLGEGGVRATATATASVPPQGPILNFKLLKLHVFRKKLSGCSFKKVVVSLFCACFVNLFNNDFPIIKRLIIMPIY